ncbi:putative mitochondrial protein AtMg00820 [Apium graveolens]|uniref:putative mitochondrial protein AtMg00820 n=1 Tax=Apium graveolens TaxID=4045 RepID=UPI003D7B0BC1
MVYTTIEPEYTCLLSTVALNRDPLHYKDVVADPGWVQAMKTELQALESNNTWTITSLPPNKKTIGCKWIFKTKYHLDGFVDKKKARLVVFGCNQTHGEDYSETLTPMENMTTITTLLAVAAILD